MSGREPYNVPSRPLTTNVSNGPVSNTFHNSNSNSNNMNNNNTQSSRHSSVRPPPAKMERRLSIPSLQNTKSASSFLSASSSSFQPSTSQTASFQPSTSTQSFFPSFSMDNGTMNMSSNGINSSISNSISNSNNNITGSGMHGGGSISRNNSNAFQQPFISATATPFTPYDTHNSLHDHSNANMNAHNNGNGAMNAGNTILTSGNNTLTSGYTVYQQESLFNNSNVKSSAELGFLHHQRPLLTWKVLHGVQQTLRADVPEATPSGFGGTAFFNNLASITPSFVDSAFQHNSIDPNAPASIPTDDKVSMPLHLTGLHPSVVQMPLPQQMSLLSVSQLLNPPVINCVMRPHGVTLGYKQYKPLSLRLHNAQSQKNAADSNSNSLMTEVDGKIEVTAQGETRLVDWVWSRGISRKCKMCQKEAVMQCLISVKAGVQVDHTLFCSMMCVRENLQKNKPRLTRLMHLTAMPSACDDGVERNVMAGEWFEDVDEHDKQRKKQALLRQQANQAKYNVHANSDFVNAITANNTVTVTLEDKSTPEPTYIPGSYLSNSIASSVQAVPAKNKDVPIYSWGCYEGICTRFPAPFEDNFTFVSSDLEYQPKSADLYCALRLDVAPAVVVDPSMVGNNKNRSFYVDPSFSQKWRSLVTKPVLDLPAPVPPRKRLISNSKLSASYSPGFQFKVLHYNVLSDILASPTLYAYCPPWALSWNYRSTLIIQEILANDADIVCLQEVDGSHFDFFLTELRKAGYSGEFLAKAKYYEADGCATFYKTAKFNLLDCTPINYDELILGHISSMHKSAADSNILQRRYLRGNVALTLLLEPTTVNPYNSIPLPPICVTNTHIFWDPKFPDVKLLQVWFLMSEIASLFPSTPLIISGDFNSTPDSSLYEFLLTKSVREESLHDIPVEYLQNLPSEQDLVHNISLQSAYSYVKAQVLPHYNYKDGFAPHLEPQFTNYTKTFKGTLDYILFSNELICHEVLEIDDETILSEHVALPSPAKPSDHISLVAVFELPF